MKKLNAAAAEKLRTSGITETQALELGMHSVDSAAVLQTYFDGVPAIVIPYYGTDRQPLRANKAWPPFYRIRYLTGDIKGFADAAGAKKQRYTQPNDVGVCAYFASCTAWSKIKDNPDEPILITEGELKAAKACLEGFPTIGLGGVYNFRSSKAGLFFLPELEEFVWARRRVTVVYDSDYVEKPGICAAINSLAEELQARGAIIELATLPDVYDDDRKTGLDDFLVERDDEALIRVLANAEPIFLTSQLWRMNEEVCYVSSPGLVLDVRTDQKMAPTAFTGHSRWSTASVPERTVSKDGQISYEKVDAASAWLSWPLRRSADRLTFAPGEDKFVINKHGRMEYNQWQGWGCEPKKGDIKPFLQLVEFLFAGADKAHVEWFYDWCAYPLQRPGTKLFSAVVVHGTATGTGKSLVGYTLGKIYGDHFAKIKNEDLKRSFNGWAENKQFILGDEISGTDKRAEADALKTTITQEEITINIKMVPEYSVRDCINYYFTSNHVEAFFLEDQDRRYYIHEVVHAAPLPEEFYLAYDHWKENGGPSALFHWLLQRDLSKFNPKAAPPKTAARARMLMHGKSDLGVWCAELREFPAHKLTIGQLAHRRDMFTSHELMDMYLSENESARGKITANGMGRALAAAGFKQAMHGNPIPARGKQGRYYIVRNFDEWAKAKQGAIVKNIELDPVRKS